MSNVKQLQNQENFDAHDDEYQNENNIEIIPSKLINKIMLNNEVIDFDNSEQFNSQSPSSQSQDNNIKSIGNLNQEIQCDQPIGNQTQQKNDSSIQNNFFENPTKIVQKQLNLQKKGSSLVENQEDEMGEVQEWAQKTAKVKNSQNGKQKDSDDSGYEEDNDPEDEVEFNNIFLFDGNPLSPNKMHQQQQLKHPHKNATTATVPNNNQIQSQQFGIALTNKEQQINKAAKKSSDQVVANNLQQKLRMIQLSKNSAEEYSQSNKKNVQTVVQVQQQQQQHNDMSKQQIETVDKAETNNININQNNQNEINKKQAHLKSSFLSGHSSQSSSPNSPELKKNNKLNNTKPDRDQVQQELAIGKSQQVQFLSDQNVGDEWDIANDLALNDIGFELQTQNQFRNEINFISAWSQIKQLNLSLQKQHIVVEDTSTLGFLAKLLKLCRHSNIIQVSLLNERDQLFAFAKVQFDVQNQLHNQILFSVYNGFMKHSTPPGIEHNYSRYGSHWEQIGFQGNDPATDLRGVGLLGLLQMLALIQFQPELARELHKHSISQQHHFPMCCFLLNMTEIVLQALRTGYLNSMINRDQSVINTVNNLYFAIVFQFFMCYRTRNCTIREYGNLKNEIKNDAINNPMSVINKFKTGIELFKKQNFYPYSPNEHSLNQQINGQKSYTLTSNQQQQLKNTPNSQNLFMLDIDAKF